MASLYKIPVAEANVLKATGTEDRAGSEVPTVVPRGAENGAALLASPSLQIAPSCTDRRGGTSNAVAVTPRRGRTIRANPHQFAPGCTSGERQGPSRIRTGDGGFAIRCPIA
jgi:hypothetical protein